MDMGAIFPRDNRLCRVRVILPTRVTPGGIWVCDYGPILALEGALVGAGCGASDAFL